MYYVYILQGLRYYVGYTSNLTLRFAQHISGKTKSTSKYGELKIVGYFTCETKEKAIDLERTIKRSKNIKKRIGKEGFIWHPARVV